MAENKAQDEFEKERQATRRRGEKAIGIAKQRAEAIRGIEGAERTAAQQQIGGVRRRTGQAIAASYNPFQTGGGGQIAGLSQVAMQRGAEEGGIEADATRRIASARVAGQEAELEAIKFEQEATPSARQEFLDLQSSINQFIELDRGDKANADYIMQIANTSVSDDVYAQLVGMARKYNKDVEGVDRERYEKKFTKGFIRQDTGERIDTEDLE